MTTGNFWDTEVWSFIITITILLVVMMVANMLRRTIKPLRKMLIPSSVLGGFLLLFVNFVYKQIFNGESMFSAQMLESITYHGVGLGFVARSKRTAISALKASTRALWSWADILFRRFWVFP